VLLTTGPRYCLSMKIKRHSDSAETIGPYRYQRRRRRYARISTERYFPIFSIIWTAVSRRVSRTCTLARVFIFTADDGIRNSIPADTTRTKTGISMGNAGRAASPSSTYLRRIPRPKISGVFIKTVSSRHPLVQHDCTHLRPTITNITAPKRTRTSRRKRKCSGN